MSFVNLHTHSTFSIRDSIGRIPDMVSRAKEVGYSAFAITEHGNLSSSITFYNECKNQGIKPVIGSELYLATRTRYDKEKQFDKYSHIILLAMNKTGWVNLCQLVTKSNEPHAFYNKPRIDRELLREHNDGLICLSACIGGEIPKTILKKYQVQCDITESNEVKNGYDKDIDELVNWYKDVFGDRFYLEVQNHHIKNDAGFAFEDFVTNEIFELSKKHKVKVVATTDTHIVRAEDRMAHNIMLAMNNKNALATDPGFGYPGDGYHIMSEKEMLALFPNNPEIIHESGNIAERCNLEFEFGNFKLPHIIDIRKEDQFFRDEVIAGLRRKMGNNIPDKYIERLDMEIDTIVKMTFPSYFLMLQEFIAWGKRNDILFSPARGSAAGSLVAFAMDITTVDPIKYDLSFARFLNSGRMSYPQIDFEEYPLQEWRNARNDK